VIIARKADTNSDAGETKACDGVNELLTMIADQANENKLTSAQAASFTAQARSLMAAFSC
jgi:hypothetical protein